MKTKPCSGFKFVSRTRLNARRLVDVGIHFQGPPLVMIPGSCTLRLPVPSQVEARKPRETGTGPVPRMCYEGPQIINFFASVDVIV